MALLKKGLAQMLISDLAGSDAVRIVERDRLAGDPRRAQARAVSAKIDPASAAQVGKLLGARYMVLGGYFDLGGTLTRSTPASSRSRPERSSIPPA